MEIIDAIWEVRNLGVKCIEINLGESDSLDDLDKALKSIECDYSVIRLPINMPLHLENLQNQGYRFIETNIQLSCDQANFNLPKIYHRFFDMTSYNLANEQEKETILEYIKNKNIFDTDKISLDPRFSKSISGRRYYYWTKDILKKEKSQLLAIKYKDNIIGFAVNYPQVGNTSNAFLGGLFPDYKKTGLGFLPIYYNVISSLLRGDTNIITGVSSNNSPILRLHLSMGFRIEKLTYIFVKHFG